MAIYTQAPLMATLSPVQSIDIDPLLIAGLFGSLSAEPMEEITDFNTAPMGFARSTAPVPNVPKASWPWGLIWTVSSKGNGPAGKRYIPSVLEQGEVVYQIFYSTSGALYSRGGIWLTGWGEWHLR